MRKKVNEILEKEVIILVQQKEEEIKVESEFDINSGAQLDKKAVNSSVRDEEEEIKVASEFDINSGVQLDKKVVNSDDVSNEDFKYSKYFGIFTNYGEYEDYVDYKAYLEHLARTQPRARADLIKLERSMDARLNDPTVKTKEVASGVFFTGENASVSASSSGGRVPPRPQNINKVPDNRKTVQVESPKKAITGTTGSNVTNKPKG